MKVRWHAGTAEERELAALGPGDYFGEVGLIQHVPRTATVTATSPSRLLRVPGEAFLEALSSGVASPSLLEGAKARLASTRYVPERPDGAPA